MPAVEQLLIGTVRELCLTRRLGREVEVPLPPALEIILGSHAAGESGKLCAQVAQDLRFGPRAGARRRGVRGVSRRRGSRGIGFVLAARGQTAVSSNNRP